MAVSTNEAAAARPVSAPLQVFSTRFARRKLFDRVARLAVTMGGVIVIGSILAILLVIVAEVYPLLHPASVRRLADLPSTLQGRTLAVQTDEYRSVAMAVTTAGLRVVTARGAVENLDLPVLGSAEITSVSAGGRRLRALGLSDGRVLPVEFSFRRLQGGSETTVDVHALEPVAVNSAGQAVRFVAHAAREG